jgi:NADH:ubiquinone oxidoreductase subunit E
MGKEAPIYAEQVGRYVIAVCTSRICMFLGADDLLEHAEQRLDVPLGGTTADGLFTLKGIDCLATCGNAPCVTANQQLFGDVGPVRFDALLVSLVAGDFDADAGR